MFKKNADLVEDGSPYGVSKSTTSGHTKKLNKRNICGSELKQSNIFGVKNIDNR